MCMFTTLQNMEHSVRTSFGDSVSTYVGGKWAVPLNPPPQVLVQYNIASLAIWEFFSTPLMNFLQESGHGAVFK